jgi:peptide/nickel transport system permease protein
MTAPHVAAIPGIAVLVLVWGLNMIGDGLRDMLDPLLAHTTR